LQISWAEIYANTETLSPVDLDPGELSERVLKVSSSFRVIELLLPAREASLFRNIRNTRLLHFASCIPQVKLIIIQATYEEGYCHHGQYDKEPV
jgi:hypothetical protein